MQEPLMGLNKKGRPVLPNDTGPGPKSLISWMSKIGFFGEVPSTELVNTSQLATHMDLSGTQVNLSEPWLKFLIDGKILFVAKRQLMTSVSYKTINDKGDIFGDRAASNLTWVASSGTDTGLGWRACLELVSI